MSLDGPRLMTLLLCGTACSGEPTLDDLFGGRWTVTDHQEAPECGTPAPADPAWSAFEIAFVDLEGFLGITVARCEGGCDTPNAAVALDVAEDRRLAGLDTESGLFASTDGEVCQVSLIEVVAERQGDALDLGLRSFYGSLAPPADGDCQRLAEDLSDDVCDVQVSMQAVR